MFTESTKCCKAWSECLGRPKELARMIITLRCVAKSKLHVTASLQKCNLNHGKQIEISASFRIWKWGLDLHFWSKSGRLRCPNSIKYSKHGRSGGETSPPSPPEEARGNTDWYCFDSDTQKSYQALLSTGTFFEKTQHFNHFTKGFLGGRKFYQAAQNWAGRAIHQPSTCVFYFHQKNTK